MAGRALTILVIVVIVGAVIGVYLINKTPTALDEALVVRTLVEDFGKKLQNVSLLASRDQVAQELQDNYSSYVTPELLTVWQNDPLKAPGRATSSPWPDGIEISHIEMKSAALYEVQGAIVEVTNEGGGIGEVPTEAARRPVSLMVEKRGDGWRITVLTLGSYPGDGEWIYTEPNAQGIQFMYPAKVPTTFISAQEWPPKVTLVAGEYSCAEQDESLVGDRAYCIVKNSEGAAGSMYTTYKYITAQGDPIREPSASNGAGFLANVEFVLKFPQCMNYDEPQQSACKAEQASYDIDGLVDRIASSIRMQ